MANSTGGIAKIFTQLCSKSTSARSPLHIQNLSICLMIRRDRLIPQVNLVKGFAEKGKDTKEAKEDVQETKMPGFVHPETTKEESFFADKGKEDLLEIKRKAVKSKLENPEKKE